MMQHLHITLKAFEPGVLTQVCHTLDALCARAQKHMDRDGSDRVLHGSDRALHSHFTRSGLPTLKTHLTVLRSPHVHKKSREQFVMHQYKTLLRLKTHGAKHVSSMSGTESARSFQHTQRLWRLACVKHATLFASKHLTFSGVQMKHTTQYASTLWCLPHAHQK
jgi:ribosomal protein S10